MNRVLCWLAIPLLLALPGCDDEPPCTLFPVEQLHQPAGMLLAGQPEEVKVLANLIRQGRCEGVTDPNISSVYAEIYDPDQQPVASEASLVTPEMPAASIRFTPAKEGRYHFLVGFDPLGQIQQFEFLAVRDRSTEPPLQVLPGQCNALERTRSGTWLCDSNAFRGSALVQSLPDGQVAVSGDVVWVATGSQLLRYKDTGTELQLTATMVQPLGPAEYVLPSEDEAVLLLSNWIQRVIFDGTSLTATSPTRWQRTSIDGRLGDHGPQGILFRTGERLVVFQNAASFEGVLISACTYKLVDGSYVDTHEACERMNGVVVGFEPSVLWVADHTFPGESLTVLQRLELTETGFVTTATLSVPRSLALTTPLVFYRSSALPVLTPNIQSGAPVRRAAVPVYMPEQRLLRLEHLDDEVSLPRASASFFWGNIALSSGVRIRAVPTAP